LSVDHCLVGIRVRSVGVVETASVSVGGGSVGGGDGVGGGSVGGDGSGVGSHGVGVGNGVQRRGGGRGLHSLQVTLVTGLDGDGTSVESGGSVGGGESVPHGSTLVLSSKVGLGSLDLIKANTKNLN